MSYQSMLTLIDKKETELLAQLHTVREMRKLVLQESTSDLKEHFFQLYLTNIEAYCNWTKVKDPISGEESAPDETLMRGIETLAAISDVAKKAFREEILIRISSYTRKQKQFTSESHERLSEALDKYVKKHIENTLP
jgi:serine protein kinase